MATDYTREVGRGEISFRDFVLKCSRISGMIDILAFNDPIPKEFVPAPYHEEDLAKSREQLQRVRNMTLQETEDEANKRYEQQLEKLNQDREKSDQARRNYELMMGQVRAWQPPAPKYKPIKKFMMGELEKSIQGENRHYGEFLSKLPEKQTGEEYRARLIETAERGVSADASLYEREVQLAKERTEWARPLLDSLPSE